MLIITSVDTYNLCHRRLKVIKKRRRTIKFYRDDVCKLLNIKPSTLRMLLHRKKIDLNNLEEFIDFINYMLLKNKIDKVSNSTH